MSIIQHVESSIIEIQGVPAILDCDVALFYGVETKHINQAVSNNPDKFPQGYILKLPDEEWEILKSKLLTSSWGGKRKTPNAFTEKGLYMLATILKSKKATETTLAIIETFTKLRELGRSVKEMTTAKTEKEKQNLMQKTGEIITDIFADELEPNESETTVELNFAMLKFKHTMKKKKKTETEHAKN